MRWRHAGISEIRKEDDSYKIRIPDLLFEEDIVGEGLPAHWAYETTVGILIISNNELEKEGYEPQGFRTVEKDKRLCVIPKVFFPDFEGRGKPLVSEQLDEKAQAREGERRHFMFNDEMAEGTTKSCYVLNDEQFNERFKDSDAWGGTMDQVPRFHS